MAGTRTHASEIVTKRHRSDLMCSNAADLARDRTAICRLYAHSSTPARALGHAACTGMPNLGVVDERPLEPWRMVILTVVLESLSRLVDLTQPAAVARAGRTHAGVASRVPST
jgi:hypothetical protein